MGIIHVAEWRGIKVAIKEAPAQVISKEEGDEYCPAWPDCRSNAQTGPRTLFLKGSLTFHINVIISALHHHSSCTTTESTYFVLYKRVLVDKLETRTIKGEIYNLIRGYEGVVQFYGVTYPPGLNKLCIVTKYAENGSLSWHLKIAFHKLTWDNKLTLATEIASSVAYLHQNGIYHRDLHGGNILIDGTGKAMLTDFGASTVIDDRVVTSIEEFRTATMMTLEGQSRTVSDIIPWSDASSGPELVDSRTKGQSTVLQERPVKADGCLLHKNDKVEDDGKHDPLIGVMAYIAPERFRKPRYFDARCDIYSLGVLLWELTSGHSAFSKMPQDVQLAVSIMNGKREQAVEGTPNLYRELYERCWESDPELRPSLDEILSTLEEVRSRLTKDELAVTRKRNAAHGDREADFTESVSVPRPTTDCLKYILAE